MSSARWPFDWFQPRRGPLSRRGGRRPSGSRAGRRLHLEALEGRVVPATHTWTGLARDGLWSTAGNWDASAPTAAEGAGASEDVTLIFPAVRDRTTIQDIANLIVDQIQFQDGGYSIRVDETLTLRRGADPAHPTTPQISLFGGGAGILGGTITTFHEASGGGWNAVLQVVGTLSVSSALAGGDAGSGYEQTGGGLLVLAGDSTYTGTTTVSAGFLQVDGSLASSAVTLKSGSFLGGRGTVGSITTAAGAEVDPRLRVSMAAKSLTTNGDANLAGATVFLVVRPGEGVSDELIVREGSVTLTGATLLLPSGTINGAAVGQSITLIDNQGPHPVAGTFAGLPGGATVRVGRQDFRIRYDGGDGNDVTLTALTTVPNPSPSPSPSPNPPAPHVRLTAVLVTRKVRRKKVRFIRVTSSAGGEPTEMKSPLQQPTYRGVAVHVLDTDHDGSDDSVVVTGKRRKKIQSVTIRIT